VPELTRTTAAICGRTRCVVALAEQTAFVIRVRDQYGHRQYWQVGVHFVTNIDDATVLRGYDAGLLQVQGLQRSGCTTILKATVDVVPLFGELK